MRPWCASRHGPGRPPPWWPAGESWPPAGPPWAGWGRMRGRLFRRLFILLAVMFVLATGVVTVLLSAVAIALRLIDVPAGGGGLWGKAGALGGGPGCGFLGGRRGGRRPGGAGRRGRGGAGRRGGGGARPR